MFRISLSLAVVAAALAQPGERPGVLQSGSAVLSGNGKACEFRYTTRIEPPPPRMADVRITGGISVDRRAIHREMTDDVHHESFGYDVTATAGPGADEFTVVFSPLTTASTQSAVAPLPKYPPPTVIHDGETIALDLLVSPDGKQRVVDYIQVAAAPTPAAPTSTGEARDYSPDDGTLRLEGDQMQVLLDGRPVSGPVGVTIKRGATLWLSVPNQGRYILSLVPHEGFQKTGAIRDNTISFRSGTRQFDIRTVGLLLGSKGAWNLYVLHEARYPARTDVTGVGLDRMENLLPKR